MRSGDRFGGHVSHQVSVHEYRHGLTFSLDTFRAPRPGAYGRAAPSLHSTTSVGCRAMRWETLWKFGDVAITAR